MYQRPNYVRRKEKLMENEKKDHIKSNSFSVHVIDQHFKAPGNPCYDIWKIVEYKETNISRSLSRFIILYSIF